MLTGWFSTAPDMLSLSLTDCEGCDCRPRLDLLKLVGGGGELSGLGMQLVLLARLLISRLASAGPSTSHTPMVGVLGLGDQALLP